MTTGVLIGRVLFALAFIALGINNFVRFQEKTGGLAGKKLPFPALLVFVSTVMFTAGGIGILLGYQIEISVLLLAAFLVPTTPIMHNFWAIEDAGQRQNQMIHFLKNLALLGGALMLLGLSQPWPNSLGG